MPASRALQRPKSLFLVFRSTDSVLSISPTVSGISALSSGRSPQIDRNYEQVVIGEVQRRRISLPRRWVHKARRGPIGPGPRESHTNLPNAYAATSDAAGKDATQPHVRRRIPWFALSGATTTLIKAHNSAPTSNAALGPPQEEEAAWVSAPSCPYSEPPAPGRSTTSRPTPTRSPPSHSPAAAYLCRHPTRPDPRAVAAAEVAPTAAYLWGRYTPPR